MWKKVFTWGLVAFLLFFVATRPHDASAVMGKLGSGLKAIGIGLGDFISGML
ncbi:MAG: hypothetical protein ACR2JX_05245 [Mycobacteriales bacterium]